ncbi:MULTISPECIES: hypothetical protein [unclassified Variovorax]|uniref:hypothetical protein n=1 Tax=unclassified Variovorax TaxID=663243 RepID=UPI003F51AB8C
MSTDNDLQDDALRRALAHAPDHTSVPHWRLRKAILERAHDAVAPASITHAREPQARPWWQRLVGLGGGSRMPWNAAFATVLVATLVTVLWQREPVPGARPDGEAMVAAQAPRVEAPAAPAVPAPPASTVPAPPTESASVPSSAPPAPVLEAPAAPAPPPALARPQADEAESKKKETPQAPAAQSAPPAPAAPVVPAEPSADAAARPAPRDSLAARARREEEAAAKQAFAPPASPPAGLVAPGDAAGAARAARPASPTVRTEATEPPTFAALSQWNRITIAQRGGASRSLSRAEALDLNALLGSAAITAVGGQPLVSTPEWRISLERNGEVLAVFEVARGQVRWREGRALPATGAPSAPALAALNEALRNAVQAPESAAQPEAGPPPAAPR